MLLFSLFLNLLLLVPTILSAALPTTYGLQELDKRDYATVKGVLVNIEQNLGTLTQKVKAFNGDPEAAVPVLNQAELLLKLMSEGAKKITENQPTPLGLLDAINILSPVYSLNNAVDATVNALIAKKPDFEKAYIGVVVSELLGRFRVSADELVSAIVNSLPSYIPGVIGTTVASPILSKLDKAVTAFKGAQ